MTTEARGRRSRMVRWSLGAALVLLPLAAMPFTDAVDWSARDFAVAAALVGGAGLAHEGVVRTARDRAYRAGAAVALATGFLLVWLNGAVGIIGSEDNPANLLYGAVIVVAVFGALIARFHPRGMARAMVAAAGAQVSVAPVAAATFGLADLPDTLLLTALFALSWLASAGLFRISPGHGRRRP